MAGHACAVENPFILKTRAEVIKALGDWGGADLIRDAVSCQVRERLKDDLVFDVQQRERTMESRRLGDVDASRMPSLERAAEQALSEICRIRVEGDLVGVVDVPIEPLALVIAAGSDSAPRQFKLLLACELADLQRPSPLSHEHQFNLRALNAAWRRSP